jgi:ribosome biogenesis GTPase / thiamine phosphate phosphatase
LRVIHSIGTVLAAFGRQYEVSLDDGSCLLAHPKGKQSLFVCGDRVVCSTDGAVVRALERENLLYRTDAFRQKRIAANLDLVVVVVATEPSFSDALLTRCLCAAEDQAIPTLIVLNKIDCIEKRSYAHALLSPFAALAYPIVELSALTNPQQALCALAPYLDGKRSLLVGGSGMGKSTLLNALVPGALAKTREISSALDSGKHTTTSARAYPLAQGGYVIDSPGLQSFGLAHLSEADLTWSFRELRPFAGECRFRNCQHDKEPGCAFHHAVKMGQIHPRRLELHAVLQQERAFAAKRVHQ